MDLLTTSTVGIDTSCDCSFYPTFRLRIHNFSVPWISIVSTSTYLYRTFLLTFTKTVMRVYQRSPYNTRSTELMPFVLVLVRVYKLYIFLKYGSPLTHRNLRLGCGGAAISRLPERLFGRQPRTLSPQDYRSSQKSGRCVDSGF